MELFRKKNTNTNFVFPLVSSGSNTYYTTSAWTNLTNSSISAYSWSDTSAPSVFSLSQIPTQLSATGLWNLSATAAEMNPNSGNDDYIAIKLKADQIQEQTLLVILTNYSIQRLADTSNRVNSNQVQVSGINDGLFIGTSAYNNFPQVSVSAGTVNNLTNPVTVSAYQNFPQVSVSAQTNHPSVNVSSINNVAASSVTAINANQGTTSPIIFNGQAVNVNLVSAGGTALTATQVVGGRLSVSVGNMANNVLTNAAINAGAISQSKITSPLYVDVSAQTNHPQVQISGIAGGLSVGVSAVTTGVIANDVWNAKLSANNQFASFGQAVQPNSYGYAQSGTTTFIQLASTEPAIDDYYDGQIIQIVSGVGVGQGRIIDKYTGSNKIATVFESWKTAPTSGSVYMIRPLGEVEVGSLTAANIPNITVSAYQNFPQVHVSGINTGVYGSISAYQNFPQVQISGINGNLFVGTSAYQNFPQVYVSAGTVNNVINPVGVSGSVVSYISGTVSAVIVSGTVTNVTNPVAVSAYTNFPTVTVGNKVQVSGIDANVITSSSIADGALISADFQTDYYNKIQSLSPSVTFGSVNVSSVDGGVYVGTSAYQNFPQVFVSGIDGGLYVGTSAYQNFPQVFASGGNVNVNNPVSVSAFTNFPQVTVSANLDKTNYTVSAGTVNNVTNPVSVSAQTNHPQVHVSGINGELFVGTSAYTNFPQVSVSAIDSGVIGSIKNGLASATDLTNVQNTVDAINAQTSALTFNGSAVNAYSVNEITVGAVTVSAYENFPQVQVSGINSGVYGGVSAYQNFPQVYVSAIDPAIQISAVIGPVTVSAYQNFPQVTVSANLDKTNYTISAGTVNNITNSVTVSAYENFPSVNVSSINQNVIDQIQSGLASAIDSTNILNTLSAISAVTSQFTFSGSAVNAYSVNEITVSAVVSGMDTLQNTVNAINANTSALTFNGSAVNAYSINELTLGKVQVSGIDDGIYVGTSAYQNFPSVNVSSVSSGVAVSATIDNVIVSGLTQYAINQIQNGLASATDLANVQTTVNAISAKTNGLNFSGTDVLAYSTNELTVSAIVANPVAVSAYYNFPSVNISSIDGGVFVGTSAYQNFPQVMVSANLDKDNYTISAGTINDVTNPVSVSAQTNHPEVQVSGVNGDLFIGTSAYTNFPEVYVSAIDPAIQISAVIGPVTVSAYQNFPQVTVSANLDKDNYIISGGTVNNVINPVEVSGTVNVNGSVSVSAIDSSVISSIKSGLASATDLMNVQNTVDAINTKTSGLNFSGTDVLAYSTNEITVSAVVSGMDNLQNTVNAINAKTSGLTFNGSAVNAYSVNEMTVGEVTVSAYKNFPQVYVSGIGIPVSVSGNVDVNMSQIFSASVSAIDTIFSFSGAEAIVSANVVQVNSTPVTIDDMKNSHAEMVSAAQSAIDNRFTFSGSDVMAYTTNIVPIDANIIMSAAQSAIDNRFTFSGADVMAYSTNEITVSAVVSGMDTLQNTVNAINAKTSGLNFSGADVLAYSTNELTVSGGVNVTALTSAAVGDILNSLVDTKTLTEIFTILLANAVGNVDRSGYVFTYKKQDGLTTAFQNTMTSTTRRRTV